jgi:hypothetical protein
MNSEYIRASCAYQIASGAQAASPAATSPVRRSNNSRPQRKSAGTSAAPAMIDGSRTASSPSPKSLTFPQSSR